MHEIYQTGNNNLRGKNLCRIRLTESYRESHRGRGIKREKERGRGSQTDRQTETETERAREKEREKS